MIIIMPGYAHARSFTTEASLVKVRSGPGDKPEDAKKKKEEHLAGSTQYNLPDFGKATDSALLKRLIRLNYGTEHFVAFE